MTPGGAPGGGVTPGGRGVGRGGRTPYVGKKVRLSAEQSYWLGAVTLPWEGTFLPTGGGDGYDGREMTIEEAVTHGRGWKKDELPTIVFVYDPSSKAHMKSLTKVSQDARFVSASHYFNLFRVDARTIKDRRLKRKVKEPTFFLFRANGASAGVVKKAMSYKQLQRPVSGIFQEDFAKSEEEALASMSAVLARRSWVEDEIRRYETVLFDPVTGKLQPGVKDRIAKYKEELKDLRKHEKMLTRLRSGALVASR